MTKILNFVFCCFIFSSCAPIEDSTISTTPYIKNQIREAVKNVTLIGQNLRGNPNNVGGNENSVYEPSSYFGFQKAVWMNHPEISDICLIAIIASDHGFNKINWNSFFHGIDPSLKPEVIDKTIHASRSRYNDICINYAYGHDLPYDSYLEKVSGFVSE